MCVGGESEWRQWQDLPPWRASPQSEKKTSKENPLVFRDPNGKDWGVSVGQLLFPCRFSVFDIAFCYGAKQMNG